MLWVLMAAQASELCMPSALPPATAELQNIIATPGSCMPHAAHAKTSPQRGLNVPRRFWLWISVVQITFLEKKMKYVLWNIQDWKELKCQHKGWKLMQVLMFAPVIFICLPQPDIKQHARDLQPNSFLNWLPMAWLHTVLLPSSTTSISNTCLSTTCGLDKWPELAQRCHQT